MSTPLLARRIRPAYLIAGGLALSVTGMLLVTQAQPPSTTAAIVVGFAVTSFGGGPLVSLGTNLVIGSAPPDRASSAGGVVQTGNEFGYALGIAILGSIGTFVYRERITGTLPAALPSSPTAAARESLAGAASTATGLPGDLAAQVLAAARTAFTSGLHVAAGITAAILAGVAILTVTQLRHVRPLDTTPSAAEPADTLTPTAG